MISGFGDVSMDPGGSFEVWRPTANRYPLRQRLPVVEPAWRKRKKNRARVARMEHNMARKNPHLEERHQDLGMCPLSPKPILFIFGGTRILQIIEAIIYNRITHELIDHQWLLVHGSWLKACLKARGSRQEKFGVRAWSLGDPAPIFSQP